MTLEMLKSKIHRATVTQSALDYIGSITVDETLMEATYVICGEANSGIICLNGAAARMVSTGDKVIIMSYAQMTPEEIKENPPKVVFVNDDNTISRITRYEKHGKLSDLK